MSSIFPVSIRRLLNVLKRNVSTPISPWNRYGNLINKAKAKIIAIFLTFEEI